jgi:histidyl-tRNA synthetase
MARAKKQFTTLPGMHDILKEDIVLFKKIENITRALASFYGFSEIITPVLEEEELYIKTTGENTDIVKKEMYCFPTKGEGRVVLRPEFTPSMARAYIQNGMEVWSKPVKLWTIGPLFRHERPQKGRLRQFNQFNFEIFGSDSPALDAYLIQLFSNILNEIGLKNWRLEVNSIGDKNCRPRYLRQLKNYYQGKINHVCPDCKKRIETNILRVLDCKEEKCQRVKKFAPQIVNYLDPDCHEHFKSLLELLDSMEIEYILNPYLVRGLDYYTRTVFEFIPEGKEESRQNTLIAGGRYDELVESMGGKEPTAAIGGAGGIERIIDELKERQIEIASEIIDKNISYTETPKVFLVQLGDLAKKCSLKLIEEFKKHRMKIGEDIGKDNLKSQLAKAAKANAQFAVIVGQQECLNDQVILRNMETGVQEIFFQKDIVKEVKKRVK